MDISIIIVNYNTEDHLRECLASMNWPEASITREIFLVDNNSKDGSAEFLSELKQKDGYHVILNDENLGFSRANNQAAACARGRYLMLLNPDTRLTERSLEKSVRFMDDHQEIGIMGPSIYSPSGRALKVCRKYSLMTYDYLEWTPILNKFTIASRNYRDGELDYTAVSDVDCIQGACMVIRRKALDEVGLLDERYFMYSEEEDLCRRMKSRGWRVVYNPEIKIFHHWGAATEKEAFKKFDVLVESKYLYFRKFYGESYAAVYRRTLIAIMRFRDWYYRILELRGVKHEEYCYERNLSRYLLGKLSAMK